MTDWLTHLFGLGLPLLLIPTALLLMTLVWGQASLASDYPDDIQAALPQFTQAEKGRGLILGLAFFLSLIAVCGYTTWTWLDGLADDRLLARFLDAYGMAFAVFFLFALIDLIVVDWLIICWWRPRVIVLPGTEDCAGWGDRRFHFDAQFTGKGLGALIIVPAVIAVVVAVGVAVT